VLKLERLLSLGFLIKAARLQDCKRMRIILVEWQTGISFDALWMELRH